MQTNTTHAISLEHVNKVYGRGSGQVTALDDIDFQARHGELVAIVGPSGSGKSTFLQVAGGLLTPDSGSVSIEDEAYGSLSNKQLERLRLNKIGFVLQAYNLVPYLRVSEQFALVNKVKRTPNMDADQFASVLARLGIESLLHQYPETLSGGQRQRVAIARALYANPAIVLADEPTASLDTERAYEVMQVFQEVAHATGKTIIVVTHDTRLERFTDDLYNITDGTMTHVGLPAAATAAARA